MIVLLSYNILIMGPKQPRKCQLYPFSHKMNFILIFSNAIRDIGNIIAASDRHLKTLQFCLNT